MKTRPTESTDYLATCVIFMRIGPPFFRFPASVGWGKRVRIDRRSAVNTQIDIYQSQRTTSNSCNYTRSVHHYCLNHEGSRSRRKQRQPNKTTTELPYLQQAKYTKALTPRQKSALQRRAMCMHSNRVNSTPIVRLCPRHSHMHTPQLYQRWGSG